MEQVFEAVNALLDRDGARLVAGRARIRTYAIVPLSPQAGVLEWVDHTIPFGAYLTDRSGSGAGAHSRYHPSDLSHQECRAKLTNAKDGKGSAKKADEARRRKRRAFDDICAKFRPAFRFFFVEHFANARDWSDPGQQKGDSTSLQRTRGEIVTILDVLIHDPLYRWMVSPKDARHRQRHDDADDGDDASRPGGGESNAGDANDDAERALFKVKQKLQGYEDAGHDVLSVEGQVKNLVADATDPENLCVLFPGWAPWL
ncbi:serine/threonine kinase [Aureococcus anophagefferens]|nr:serine/threonine kinase [Aureococcus anophagefferens]